jgi:hypothetical protein
VLLLLPLVAAGAARGHRSINALERQLAVVKLPRLLLLLLLLHLIWSASCIGSSTPAAGNGSVRPSAALQRRLQLALRHDAQAPLDTLRARRAQLVRRGRAVIAAAAAAARDEVRAALAQVGRPPPACGFNARAQLGALVRRQPRSRNDEGRHI